MESLEEAIPILTAASRAERATMRAAREMARREAELRGRLAHIELKDGLAATKAELERLTTCHRRAYRKLDWRSVATRPPLPMPVRGNAREKAARRALATWQPSWQDRMFGDEAQRRRELAARVPAAQREDAAAYQEARRAAEAHNAEIQVARGLFELDARAIQEAVAMKARLAELRDVVNSIALAKTANGRLLALVDAIQEADIPYERITEGNPRTARRELIADGERRQIHLTALCAAALRVGAELVSVLPVDAVEVAVGCEASPAERGRAKSQPVVQLLVTARALGDLDWMKEDAVTLVTRLGARMDWSIEKGFAPIRLISLAPANQPLAKSA